MEQYIGIGESIVISLFSIAMVFLGLVVISIFISLLSNLGVKQEEPTKAKDTNISKTNQVEDTQIIEETNDEELIAVISAAIASSLGSSVPQINIKNIRRVNDDSPVWAAAGRQEQLYNKI